MENTGISIIQLVESFGAPLAILAAVFFIIYKTVPKMLAKFLDDYKTMNNNFAELVKTSVQAMTELLAAFKSGNDGNKESFQRIYDKLDALAGKDNLERLHVQIDKIENILLNMIGGISND